MKEYLENVRCVAPLIHNITNYVTANDVANVLLACGASPIMADEEAEVEEITAHCMGLNLNLGTLNQKKIPAMQKAGKMANKLGHVVVLDPVGVGASSFRTVTRSMAPVMATIVCSFFDSIFALLICCAKFSSVTVSALSASTPLPEPSIPVIFPQ